MNTCSYCLFNVILSVVESKYLYNVNTPLSYLFPPKYFHFTPLYISYQQYSEANLDFYTMVIS